MSDCNASELKKGIKTTRPNFLHVSLHLSYPTLASIKESFTMRFRCSRGCGKLFKLTTIILLVCVLGANVYTSYNGTNIHKQLDLTKKELIPDLHSTVNVPDEVHNVAMVTELPTHMRPCPNSSAFQSQMIFPKKDATNLQLVNSEIIGDLLHKANKLNEVATEIISSLVKIRKATEKPIDEMMMGLDLMVDVDDYRLLPGGHWIPLSCKPRWKVAIVTPFRNRQSHLPIFLRHIVPFLKRQKLEFSIFIAEQRNTDILMNRAMMRGIGFIEALNFTSYDCVVFNDIDHLAINIHNYYGCEEMPRHFLSGEPKWQWELEYDAIYGGAFGVRTHQFYEVNGMPNAYWGWGGEDDDFAARLRSKGYSLSRPRDEIGFFDTIDHTDENTTVNKARKCMFADAYNRMKTDGLSNLVYETPIIELHPLYTNISVNIYPLPWNPDWTRCDEDKGNEKVD